MLAVIEEFCTDSKSRLELSSPGQSLEQVVGHVKGFCKDGRLLVSSIHMCGCSSEKPFDFMVKGERKDKVKDPHGSLDDKYAEYLIQHDPDWFDKISASKETEDIKCMEIRQRWPVPYRRFNKTASRNLYLMSVQLYFECKTLPLGPMVKRYFDKYQISPASGTFSEGSLKGKTAEIRLEQLAKFKAAFYARQDIYRDFKGLVVARLRIFDVDRPVAVQKAKTAEADDGESKGT